MPAYIKTLKNTDGDIIYPQTKTSAVFTNDGENIEKFFGKSDAVKLQNRVEQYEKFWKGTKEEYDALTVKEDDVMYIVPNSNESDSYILRSEVDINPTTGSNNIVTSGGVAAQLAEKAPAGFGYGETIRVFNFTSDTLAFTNALDGVFSQMGDDTAKQVICYDVSPPSALILSAATLTRSNANTGSLTASTDALGTRMQRIRANGVWQPWEYVNPPMQVGLEYRTTERYKGKPVYIKAVDTGALPNATYKSVTTSFPNANAIVDYGGEAYQDSGHFIPLPCLRYGSDSYNTEKGVQVTINNSTEIVIATMTNFSSFTSSSVWVKYTKTTD